MDNNTSSATNAAGEHDQTFIFTYGTLKRDFPNYPLMQDLISSNDAVFIGSYFTHHAYPLVIGPNGIPFMINLPGSGHRIRGELYNISTQGLARLDELEGTSLGHYERLPIVLDSVINCEKGYVPLCAQAYYAHRSFGEAMWEKKGRIGISRYTEKDAKEYVGKEDRPKERTFLDEIRLFLSS